MESNPFALREQHGKFLDYAKRFFGFGELPSMITIILPSVEQTRPVSLRCRNYPLFPYEMSPDDVYTALQLYSILVLLYGDRVQGVSNKEFKIRLPGHCILVGGAPTNVFSFDALKDQYYHFGGEGNHGIIGRNGEKYSAVLDGDDNIPSAERSVIRDYIIISKYSRQGNIEFVLSGCRAYGQMALWYILKDMDFYERVLPQVEGKNFQILLQVSVEGHICTSWDILDIRLGPSMDIQTGSSGYSLKTITWLHLSDLHFRVGSEYESNIVLDALLKDVSRLSHENSLSPDFIVVTGDIAFSGNPAEYKQACRFFDGLLNAVSLPKSRLLVVPGNHDVDRSALSSDPLSVGVASILDSRDKVNQFLASQNRRVVLQRLRNYANFVNEYFGPELTFDDDNYFYVKRFSIGGKKLAILGLNSAWLCGSDKDRDCILIGERQARAALKLAEDADIRIALLHHPFEWLKDFDRNDSAALLSTGCDFILHGHLHQTGVRQLRTPDSGAMIIAAGASYENREYPNCYNFVRLNTEPGKVVLRRYSDRSPGFWASDTLTYENAQDGTFVFDYRTERKR